MDKMTTWEWFKVPQFYMVCDPLLIPLDTEINLQFFCTIIQVAAVYIPGRLVINIPQAFLPLYLQKTLGLSCSMVAAIPLTYFLSGLLVATTMKKLAQWVGKQMSFGFGIVLNFIGASLILWGDWGQGSFLRETGVYLVFALLGG